MRRVRSLLALAAAVAVLAAAAPASAALPPYRSSVRPLSKAMRAQMTGNSWHRGCPVGLRGLRLVTVRYWDFHLHRRIGRLVVDRAVARDVALTFGRLYRLRYRIRRMVPIDRYGGSDFRSIEADNTSAFNCRYVDGTTRWSNHAFGTAIDLNPIENPYVTASGTTSHRASRRYVDRSRRRSPAMVLAGDRVVRAFAAIGWGWGGTWSGGHDYQHFSADGT
jgi:hypothetical protein